VGRRIRRLRRLEKRAALGETEAEQDRRALIEEKRARIAARLRELVEEGPEMTEAEREAERQAWLNDPRHEEALQELREAVERRRRGGE
jgi:hypothetical protein